MRLPIITAVALMFATCAITHGSPDAHDIVTYYDRDGDGVVDTSYIEFATPCI